MKTDATIILLGDFNFPNLTWSEPNFMDANCQSCSGFFLDFIRQHALFQLVEGITRPNSINPHIGSTLDLVFTNDIFAIDGLSISTPFSTSDHFSIPFNLLTFQTASPPAKDTYNFNNNNKFFI